jgi:hypothetical protein
MSAVDVGVLATLVLFALPVLVGVAIFTLLLGGEIPRLLRNPKIQSALELKLVSHKARWSLSEKTLPWPAMQLGWAVVAALALILFGMGSAAKDETVRDIWFIVGGASFTLAAATPVCLRLFWRLLILRLVRGEIVSRLSSLPRGEALLVRKLSALGNRIEVSYAEVNLKTSIQVAEVAKYILVQRAAGIRDTHERLTRAIKTLRKFSEEVADHLEGYRQVKRDFDFTKNVVIDRGSPTLLAELDRIKLALDSDDLRTFFDRAQWKNLESQLDQLAFDLKMIRSIAEGGSDLPLSLGQACQTLNVTSTTSLKTAKTVVDALRRVWHPDNGISEEDRERRTVKTTQINVAWEIFAAAFAEDEPVWKPRRVLELA